MIRKIIRTLFNIICVIGIIPFVILMLLINWLSPTEEELARESYEE